MDEQDTNVYFEKEGWDKISVYKDQINKQTKLINKKNPIRVTIWTMLITPIIQDLIQTIECHIKYVVFLYHAHKPITLMRCIGFHEKIKEYIIILSISLITSLYINAFYFASNLASIWNTCNPFVFNIVFVDKFHESFKFMFFTYPFFLVLRIR